MKRIIQRLKSDIKGSVAIFFIIITAAVFLFNAVLIDYARILAADQQTEYALQSAVRSAMSAYDSDLKTEYGLFGVNESDIDFFEEMLKENLELASLEAGVFRFSDIEVGTADPDFSRTLAEPDILKHQILDEMKYKAPVEITKELIEKFTFVSEAMKETSAFVDTASEINSDFEAREKLLDEINNLLASSSNSLNEIETDLTAEGLSSFPNVDNFNDIINHYPKYENAPDNISDMEIEIENKEEEIEKIEEEIKELKENTPKNPKERKEQEEKIEELEEKIEELEEEIDALKEAIDQLDDDADEFEEQAIEKIKSMRITAEEIIENLNDAIDKLEEAEELNEEIEQTICDNRAKADESYGDAIGESGPPPTGTNSGDLDEAADKLKEMSEELEEYVYDFNCDSNSGSVFFDSIKAPLVSAVEELENIPEYLDPIETDFDLSDQGSLEQLRDDLIGFHERGSSKVAEAFSYFLENRKSFEEEEPPEFDKEEQNKEAEEAANSLEEVVNDLSGDIDIYNDLGDILEEIKGFVEDVNLEESDEMEFKSKAEDSAKGAMKLIDSLFKGIGNMLVNSRDELYVNEYVLNKFESATPTGGLLNHENYLFENREVEYILYGLEEPGANFGAAIGQLSAIRFALNFISAFTDTRVRAAGHPLAIFVAALGYALKYTVDDVNEITHERTPALLRGITPSLEFGYKDYLRLFLFMNPAGDTRLMRVATVIEHKGVDLKSRQTYISGSVETSVKLWFIPEIASGLNKVGLLDGKVEGNRFIFNKEANFSY